MPSITHPSADETSFPDELAGQTALVTGAGGEIGGAIAAGLLSAGANVVWVGRSTSRLRSRAKEFGAAMDHSLFLAADVRSERQVSGAVRAAMKRFGEIGILVNNAGARGAPTPLSHLSLKEWQEVLDTNLTGAFLLSRACLPGMVRRRRGRIVNISSVASRWGYPLRAAYAASKAALNSLTMTLAQEAGEAGVQVNAISPGPVAGKAFDGVLAERAKALGISSSQMRKQFMRPSALGHAVTVDDIVHAVLFLCSECARNITGQIIEVSAGYGLWPGA